MSCPPVAVRITRDNKDAGDLLNFSSNLTSALTLDRSNVRRRMTSKRASDSYAPPKTWKKPRKHLGARTCPKTSN